MGLVLVIFSAVVTIFSFTPDRDVDNTQLLDENFLLGKWEVHLNTYEKDGSINQQKARAHAYYILDGRAILDNWKSANQSVIRITHLVLSETPNQPFSNFSWQGGELVGDGSGIDESGEYIERFKYYGIGNNGYSFASQRSYDSGKQWQTYIVAEATKVSL